MNNRNEQITATIEPYTVGETYEGKGKYLGRSKGAHKFQRHEQGHYRKNFGPMYHFEKY